MAENFPASASEQIRTKHRALFIHPGPVPPDRDPRKNLHFHISTCCEGDLLSTVWGRRKDHQNRSLAESFNTLGSFRYHATFSTGTPGLLKIIWNLGFYLRQGLGLSRSQGAFDAIIAYGPFTCSIAGWIISRLTGAKFIIEVPGPPTEGFIFQPGLLSRIKLHVARIYVPFLLRRADGLRLYYPSQLDGVRGVKFPPAFVFPDLVPLSTIASMEQVTRRIDGRYILLLGFPFNRKGVDILIKAFNKISDKHPDISLKVVGHCPDLAPYQKLAEGNPRIFLSTGVAHAQALELMAGCTIFALPSRAEGVPRVLIEAMAAGKPIVSTRVNGIPYIIEDECNGLLVDADDVDGFASKLDRLLDDPGFARKLAEEARNRVFRDLSETRYVEQFCAMMQHFKG